MLPVFFVEQIRFRLEVADLGKREFDLPAVGGAPHRHVAPGGIGHDGLTGVRGNDFLAAGGGAAEVGAEARRPFWGRGKIFAGGYGEKNFIADETHEAFAGGRSHGWFG